VCVPLYFTILASRLEGNPYVDAHSSTATEVAWLPGRFPVTNQCHVGDRRPLAYNPRYVVRHCDPTLNWHGHTALPTAAALHGHKGVSLVSEV
jgi:hypothetical protein